jgi:molybdenum storage protein
VIYIKDEDGLYTEDPKKNPKARLIPAIEANELLEMDLPELILEKSVVQTMINSRHMKQVQIVNGLKPEMINRALNGEPVGTVIYCGEENHPSKGMWPWTDGRKKTAKAKNGKTSKKSVRRVR